MEALIIAQKDYTAAVNALHRALASNPVVDSPTAAVPGERCLEELERLTPKLSRSSSRTSPPFTPSPTSSSG